MSSIKKYYPGLEDKFNEKFVDIVDQAIKNQIKTNTSSSRIVFEKVVADYFRDEILKDQSRADKLVRYLRKKVSGTFYDYILVWKKYKNDLPEVFTDERMKKCISNILPSEYQKETPIMNKVTIQEYLEEPQQVSYKQDNIVLIKYDALKENMLSITYSNVSDTHKEIILRDTVAVVDKLNGFYSRST